MVKDCISLQWRHNERDCVSNLRRLPCLLNCWFRRRSKKTSKLRVTGLCLGNSPLTGEFPTQRASNAENVSIWWRHHVKLNFGTYSSRFRPKSLFMVAAVMRLVTPPVSSKVANMDRTRWTTYREDWRENGGINSLALADIVPCEIWMEFYIYVIFKLILVTDGSGIPCEIAPIWISLDFTDNHSTLVRVMAWCHRATSHYLSQCWPTSLSPYRVTVAQLVKKCEPYSWVDILNTFYELPPGECYRNSLIGSRVIAWCRQASHYLSECWPRSLHMASLAETLIDSRNVPIFRTISSVLFD